MAKKDIPKSFQSYFWKSKKLNNNKSKIGNCSIIKFHISNIKSLDNQKLLLDTSF